MEPTQILPVNSPLTSPNSFKNLGKRSVKFDFKKSLTPKQTHGTAKLCQRRSSEKQKPVLQPLKMMFDTDPLQLFPLMNRKPGTDSPELASTPIEKKSAPSIHLTEPLNITDPLNLNDEDNSILRSNRKRKKKRNRTSSLCFDEDITIDSLHNNSSILNESAQLVSPTESLLKVSKPNPKSPIDSPTEPKATKLKLTKKAPSNCNQRKKYRYKHGNFIQSKTFGLEITPPIYINSLPVSEDQRVQNFKIEWFKGKTCLDVGCGDGYISHWISKYFQPTSVLGVDIDSGLINIAKSKSRAVLDSSDIRTQNFPISLPMVHGPILSGFKVNQKSISYVNDKLLFINEDYVPATDECLKQIKPKYETLIFLSTSKWIQLCYGDDGLRRTFKKMFLQLKPGGRLLFEPHTQNCYKKSRNMTNGIHRHDGPVRFMPSDFISYLLSTEVGFTQSICLAHTRKRKTNNARPLYLLTKGGMMSG